MYSLKFLRKQIVIASSRAKEGHIASAFSILDILWVLYDKILKYDCRNPNWEQRDRFILSKGHGSLGLYAILAAKGFFPITELTDTFANFNSMLGGHPDCNKVPGIEASTGSLGHGMPMAVGIAMALRVKCTSNLVYCLIGDGELNEGSIWEATLLASHHNLSNFVCIVDFNRSTDRALKVDDLSQKFQSFGWKAQAVDGHSQSELENCLTDLDPIRPTVIIANTIKGKGCISMENNPAWHHRSPSTQELQTLLEQIT